MTDLHEGDRVRAVHFPLDTGLRIWPVDPANDRWRVVTVVGPGPDDFEELATGGQIECQRTYPNARFGINDNETVPPGTLGTVKEIIGPNIPIAWDNGRRLNLGRNDVVERIDDSGSQLPDPPPELADAWRRFQAGERVEPYEGRAIDEWRSMCAEDAGF